MMHTHTHRRTQTREQHGVVMEGFGAERYGTLCLSSDVTGHLHSCSLSKQEVISMVVCVIDICNILSLLLLYLLSLVLLIVLSLLSLLLSSVLLVLLVMLPLLILRRYGTLRLSYDTTGCLHSCSLSNQEVIGIIIVTTSSSIITSYCYHW